MPEKNEADVIVVGAGLSGLYAAKLLRAEGLTVAVVEARDRVGGRILSQQLANGTTVDLGAQWIGPGQQRIYALVQAYGLKMGKTHTRGDAVVGFGQTLKRLSGQALPISLISLLDLLQASWRIDRGAGQMSVALPWKHPQAKQLDSTTFSDWIEKNMFSQEAQTYWRYLTETGMCASSNSFSVLEVMHQIASIGGLAQLKTADAEFFIAGARSIPQRIADELGDCVHLNTPVRSLELQDRQVRVVTNQANFYGKRVILALPPQLIAKILLDPALSTQFNERPRHFVLGEVVKNVIVYESAWWRGSGLSGAADTLGEPIEFLADTSQSERSGVLVAIASGSKAIKLSQMDEETRKATVLSHISKVLGIAPSPPICFFSMDWINEQYSCGGYAARRTTGD